MALIVNIPMLVKGTEVAGRVPGPLDIQPRQLAVNLTDEILFSKTDAGSVVQLGVKKSDLGDAAFSNLYSDLDGLPTLPEQYVLPVASTSVVGGVRPGAGTTMSGELLNANVLTVRGAEGTAKTGDVVITKSDLGLDILDANGKVLVSRLPDSITGGTVFVSLWDASTNTPTIPAADPANTGYLYRVNVPGTTDIDGNADWELGDELISNGTVWQRLPAVQSTVTEVNGQTGAVDINLTNLGASQVAMDGEYSSLLNPPSSLPPDPHTHPAAQVTGLSVVAYSGDYTSLINLPPDPSVTNISVNVEGNPIISAVTYVFTETTEFVAQFAGSKAFATMRTGQIASAGIYRAPAGSLTTDAFVLVGNLSYNTTTGVATFSSVAPTTTTFNPGDMLQYRWTTSGIAMISISLRGKRIL